MVYFMLQSSQYLQFMYFIIGYHIFVLLILKVIFVKVIFVMKDTQAIFYLNKVLEMDLKHIDALIFKGQSLYGLGNHTGAKYYFDSAFELDASNKLLKRIYNNSTKE
jgi:tetratricopeptide (TPR) repeat protein